MWCDLVDNILVHQVNKQWMAREAVQVRWCVKGAVQLECSGARVHASWVGFVAEYTVVKGARACVADSTGRWLE
mgnify:CR=1 FL=1